ncbi:MAG: TGS domain-containing protein, partial [Candidatus Obscuribacterales bacterium]|nr:TGS domain-containing protein [Candidatus Obscuribacterales bacterium]
MSQVISEEKISVFLPDGSEKNIPKGSTCGDLAKLISQGLFRQAVGCMINGEIRDLSSPLNDGDKVSILKPTDVESYELLRHSAAHVMAQAVQRVFPQAKIAIGPTIQDGFYYDFEIPDHPLNADDLEKIEAEMAKIVKEDQQLVRVNVADVDKQIAEFQAQGEKFKAELLNEHRDHNPTLYEMRDKDG